MSSVSTYDDRAAMFCGSRPPAQQKGNTMKLLLAILALLVVSTAASACESIDYAQLKDELARDGKQAMIERYCALRRDKLAALDRWIESRGAIRDGWTRKCPAPPRPLTGCAV